eukprot:SAG11_NODE_438_length_9463_cov_47.214957_2_plen_166_part_00
MITTWMAAFGALGEAGAQMGGGGVAVGDVAVGNDGSAGDGADVGVGGCGACGDITADGRQAADGDHVADLWRGRMSGPRGRRLEPTTGYHEDAWRCWAAAWLQAVGAYPTYPCYRRYFSTYEILTAVQRPRYRTGLPRVQKSTQSKTYMTALPRSSTKFSPDHSY